MREAIFLLSVTMAFAGCREPAQTGGSKPDFLSHIQDEEARNVLYSAMERAGGWDTYSAVRQISYSKQSVLYDSAGQVESALAQDHVYTLQPGLSGDITWSAGGVPHRIHFAQGSAIKIEGDGVVEGGAKAATESFNSAFYVLLMPFKLADPGAEITYEGTRTLDSGKEAHVIKAVYDPGTHENHSTSDVWWYFFDTANSTYLASMVHHPPTYALIENTEMTWDLALTFNTYRRSYRCDSLGNKIFLRGEFYYSDYALIFRESAPD